MEVHRRLSRIKLPYYIRVFDEAAGTMLGHIAGITVEGMMVISERPVPVDTVFQLSIELHSDEDHRERIYVEAKSIWARQDANADFYDVGFQLINPASEVVKKIDELIDQFTI